MTIYSEYAKTKTQIQVLNDRLKELSGQILEEVKGLSEPMRTEDGMFSKVITNKTVYSEKVDELAKEKTKEVSKFKKQAFEEVLSLQKEEENNGIAKRVEEVSLRFTPKKSE